MPRSRDDLRIAGPRHWKNDTFLPYRVIPLQVRGQTRHLLQHRETKFTPSTAALYEAYRASSRRSPETIDREMRGLAFLFTWADEIGIDIDDVCATRGALLPTEINAFGGWLHSSSVRPDGYVRRRDNAPIGLAGLKFFKFSLLHIYGCPELPLEDRLLALQAILATHAGLWETLTVARSVDGPAPDLTDDEIRRIEDFLLPEHRMRIGVPAAIAWRDYLIWRLAIALGLRLGEILALRVRDCPSAARKHFEVRRLEDRSGEQDPRGIYRPRPKTTSRDVAPVKPDTEVGRLCGVYVSRFRGARIRRAEPLSALTDHNFLVVSHTTGAPLSKAEMEQVASIIREGSGVTSFHWHLARHAFYNRLYTDIKDNRDCPIKSIAAMLVHGGWRSVRSARPYIRASLAAEARGDLRRYQEPE